MVCCVAALAVMAAFGRLVRALRGGGRNVFAAGTAFAPPARYVVTR